MDKAFEVGDLVWAKMKGYPPWPGKVVEAPENKKIDKKSKHYVYFFGSQNHAVVSVDMIWPYQENKEKYMVQTRPSSIFQTSIDEIEDYIKSITTTPEPECMSPTNIIPEVEEKERQPKSDRKRTSSTGIASPPRPLKNRLLERDFMAALSSADKKQLDDKKDQDSSNKIETPIEKLKSPTVSKTPQPDISESNEVEDKRAAEFSVPIDKVGLVGTGDIGEVILEGLTSAGLDVHIWNKNIAKSKESPKASVTKASSASDVVQSCNFTFICAEDAADIKNLAFGKSGLLHGLSAQKGLINLSTIDIDTTQTLHEAIILREGRYLEAPIVGSRLGQVGGHLVILAAGDKSLFDQSSNIFKSITKHVFYLGEVGLACKMKLVLDGLMGTTLAGLAESLALASKVGLDPSEFLNVLTSSPVSSSFIKQMGADMIKSRLMEVSHCKLSSMQQHLRMMINMSESVDQPLHVTSAVSELFKKAKAKGYGDSDMVAVFRATDL